MEGKIGLITLGASVETRDAIGDVLWKGTGDRRLVPIQGWAWGLIARGHAWLKS